MEKEKKMKWTGEQGRRRGEEGGQTKRESERETRGRKGSGQRVRR